MVALCHQLSSEIIYWWPPWAVVRPGLWQMSVSSWPMHGRCVFCVHASLTPTPNAFMSAFICIGSCGQQARWGTTFVCSFPASATQKWKFPKLIFFFYTLTIQNDQIPYAKHVLAPLDVFFNLFGCGRGGLPRRLGHNLLMQFSSLGSSRMAVPLPSSRCLAEGNRIFFSTMSGGPSN